MLFQTDCSLNFKNLRFKNLKVDLIFELKNYEEHIL